MPLLRKLLILSHRYIGIPLSFLFVLWFVSAFVMIYAGGMPRITPAMRLAGAGVLDFVRVQISAAKAASIAGISPTTASLRMVLGRPVYDFAEAGFSTRVFADDGAVLADLSLAQAQQVGADFLSMPVSALHYQATLTEADQWTLTQRNDLPLYKFAVADELDTEIYVAPGQAAVSVYTTDRSRLLAWLGTIPHWLYFTSLRLNQPLWYEFVVWSAGIGCVLAVLGLMLGVTQFRRIRPFSLWRSLPYRGGMRWHYLLGLIFGVFTLTWVFSGLLSMEPFAWTRARGLEVDPEVYTRGELDLAAFPNPQGQNWSELVPGEIKTVEFIWIQGRAHYLLNYVPHNLVPDNLGHSPMPSLANQTDGQVEHAHAGEIAERKRERLHQPYPIDGQAQADSLLLDAASFTVQPVFDSALLASQLDEAAPTAKVSAYELLRDYDDYYYSRANQLPLPVLRIKFDDPAASWFYVDPRQSRILAMAHRWSRLERWLYNGLHSLDFAFWYHRRPLWDIAVLFLLFGGLAGSVTGLYFGLRRVQRDLSGLLAK
ncbi:MAG: hypothetical protein RQ899_09510 [Pseudomonadales bacterium]|nr:hypothetical protein [Pseudomonadales bacterium]